MDQQLLLDNTTKLRERVRRKLQKGEIGNSGILVLAVSKTRTADDIRYAYECGWSDFGENYLQEALEKMDLLTDLPLVWHFIGPLQSNKTRPVAERFNWVHTVDREKIARRLSEQRPDALPPLQVCLQVNISGEESKSGASVEDLPALARAVAEMPRLTLRGLMCVPAPSTDEQQQRHAFAQLRRLLHDLQDQVATLDTLSMGMSSDLEAAIDEGATILRVGTAIFGPRGR